MTPAEAGTTETPPAPNATEGVPVLPGSGTVGPSTESSIPQVGAYRTSDHQYFANGVGPYHSVTTYLDIIHKEALSYWRANTVAEFAVESFQNGQLARQMVMGAAQTAKWLASLPEYQRNSAARLGTRVHHLADLLGRDGKPLEGFGISEDALPFAQAVADFLEHYGRHNIVSSEKAVINFSEGYAGTYDLLLRVQNAEAFTKQELWLIDYKTSKGLYPETGLQLAAYGNAEYIIVPGDPTLYPMPHIDRYGVVHIRPDLYEKGWRFVEYQVTDTDYRAFLAARDLWHWRKEGRFKDNQPVPSPV